MASTLIIIGVKISMSCLNKHVLFLWGGGRSHQKMAFKFLKYHVSLWLQHIWENKSCIGLNYLINKIRALKLPLPLVENCNIFHSRSKLFRIHQNAFFFKSFNIRKFVIRFYIYCFFIVYNLSFNQNWNIFTF